MRFPTGRKTAQRNVERKVEHPGLIPAGGDPYRTAAELPAPRRSFDSTRPSAVPLLVMAVAFFLPVAQGCNHEVIAPIDEAAQGVLPCLWITPTYLAAALLFVAVVATYRTRRARTGLASAAVALAWVTSVTWMIAVVAQHARIALYVAVLPSLPIAVFAWRRCFGLRRLAVLLDAYAFAAFPMVAVNATLAQYYGAYVFVGAYAVFVCLRSARWIGALRRWRAERFTDRCAGGPRAAPLARALARHPAR
jgi:hypothetical protein